MGIMETKCAHSRGNGRSVNDGKTLLGQELNTVQSSFCQGKFCCGDSTVAAVADQYCQRRLSLDYTSNIRQETKIS